MIRPILALVALFACHPAPTTPPLPPPPTPEVVDCPDLPPPTPDLSDELEAAHAEIDRLKAVASEPAVPDGFPPEDEFSSPREAGRIMGARVVCPNTWNGERCKGKDDEFRRRAIFRHWRKRVRSSWHVKDPDDAKPRSRIDSSQTHDRDRPMAWKFHATAVAQGWLTPETCVWHQVDPNVGHTALEHRWSKHWPYDDARTSAKGLRRWIEHSHAFEAWSARGIVDWPPAWMMRYMPDRCFDPAMFERLDVSAYGFAVKNEALCGEAKEIGAVCSYEWLRCRSSPKLRRRWDKCRELGFGKPNDNGG